MGEMADYHMYDYDYDIDEGFLAQPPINKLKTCNRCGADGLHWKKFFGKWKLAQPGGSIHVCETRRPKRSNLPDVPL